jgi:archaellum component FlaG (FlaF/FlaG flagellin family)
VIHLANDANRMDVLYNDTTKTYVMFLKYIGNGAYFGSPDVFMGVAAAI